MRPSKLSLHHLPQRVGGPRELGSDWASSKLLLSASALYLLLLSQMRLSRWTEGDACINFHFGILK